MSLPVQSSTSGLFLPPVVVQYFVYLLLFRLVIVHSTTTIQRLIQQSVPLPVDDGVEFLYQKLHRYRVIFNSKSRSFYVELKEM